MVITLYAGIFGIFYLVLSFLTIQGRFRYHVSLGDGENQELLKRIRAHGNFFEYVPFALFLIFMVELEQSPEWMIHVLAIILIIGRILHAFGLYRPNSVNKGRMIGMILTFTTILIASVLCIRSYFIF